MQLQGPFCILERHQFLTYWLLFFESFLHVTSYCSEAKNSLVLCTASFIFSNTLPWMYCFGYSLPLALQCYLQNLFGQLLTHPHGSLCSTILISHFLLFTSIICTQPLAMAWEVALHTYYNVFTINIEHTTLYMCVLTLSHSILRAYCSSSWNCCHFHCIYRRPKPLFSSQSTEESPQNPHSQLKYICFIFHIVALALHPLVHFASFHPSLQAIQVSRPGCRMKSGNLLRKCFRHVVSKYISKCKSKY